jgi:hypothetical protein
MLFILIGVIMPSKKPVVDDTDYSQFILHHEDAGKFQIFPFIPMSVLTSMSAPRITRVGEYAPGKYNLLPPVDVKDRVYPDMRISLFLDDAEDGIYQSVIWGHERDERGIPLYKRDNAGNLLLDDNDNPMPVMTPSRYIWRVSRKNGVPTCESIKYVDALKEFGVEATPRQQQNPLAKKG